MKSLSPDLFPETLLVSAEAGRVFTTSLKVAEHFHKKHKNVLQAIKNLLGDTASQPSFGPADDPKIGIIDEFKGLTFQPSEYLDSRGRTKPMYRLTVEGFALLAMGFTGNEALVWKIQSLNAFCEMKHQLLAQQAREANALYQLRPRWQPIVQHPELNRQKLIGLTGHKSAGSITACRRRMRDIGLLGLGC